MFFPVFDLYIRLQAITRYIKGIVKKDTAPVAEEPKPKPKPKKVKKVYTIRDIIKQHYRTLVDNEIPFKSTDKDFRYLGSFQKAVTTVLNKMSEEELEEAENLVELWNREGGPSDLQLK